METRTRERLGILPGVLMDQLAKSDQEKEYKSLWSHGVVFTLTN